MERKNFNTKEKEIEPQCQRERKRISMHGREKVRMARRKKAMAKEREKGSTKGRKSVMAREREKG